MPLRTPLFCPIERPKSQFPISRARSGLAIRTGRASSVYGGGVKAGHAHGAADEYGCEAVGGKVHVHDWPAAILHLMASTTRSSPAATSAATRA